MPGTGSGHRKGDMRISTRTIAVTAIPLTLAGIVAASAWVAVSGDGKGDVNTRAASPVTLFVNGAGSVGIGDSVPLTITANNPNKGTVKLNEVKLTVANAPQNCDPSNFTVTLNDDAKGAKTVAAGNGQAIGTATLALKSDDTADQSACTATGGKVTVAAHADPFTAAP